MKKNVIYCLIFSLFLVFLLTGSACSDKTGNSIKNETPSVSPVSKKANASPAPSETAPLAKPSKPVLVAKGSSLGKSKRFVVVPGKSVGLIEIGKPISKKVMKLMGKPTRFTPPTSGKSGLDTGSYYWEGKLIVKINDGKGDMNVYQAFIISEKYYTTMGIRRGSDFSELKRCYPKGKKVEMMDMDFGWEIPGMTFGIYNKKVSSMSISPLK